MNDLSKRLGQLSPAQRELLLKKLKKAKPENTASKKIGKRPDQARYTLSSAQERLWFLYQLEPNSALYNISTALHLHGKLSIPALEFAINRIAERHEVLRATFPSESGVPVQTITPELTLKLELTDLSEVPKPEKDIKLNKAIVAATGKPFNLEKDHLVRCSLIKLSNENHVLTLCLHHIVADGWSVNLMIREFGLFYSAFPDAQKAYLPELTIQYADYAHWQIERSQKEQTQNQLKYWTGHLDGMPQSLDILTDRPRPAIQTFNGLQHRFWLDEKLTKKIKNFCSKKNISQYAALMAAFHIFLSKISGQNDFGVGAPIANRNRSEVESLIGFLVNTIVLRANIDPGSSYEQFAERIKNDVLQASENQDVPFEQIVEKLVPQRELSRPPLFQVMFDLQNIPIGAGRINGLEMELIDIELNIAKFDILLMMFDYSDRLKCSFEYNTDLFDKETIERFGKYFSTLLSQIFEDPARKIADLSLVSPADQQTLLTQWNQTKSSYPDDLAVNQIFEQQVEHTPEAIALSFNGSEFSYADLNRQANRIARLLIKNGVEKDDLVALYMDRTADFFASVLGILKTGAAYVPLDTAYPAERLAFMLEDSASKLLISQESLLQNLPQNSPPILCLDKEGPNIDRQADTNPDTSTNGHGRAYIIYTSGSTGKPKGVVVPHKAISRLVINTNYIEVTPEDRIAQISNATFDAATFEIWGAFLNGATLVGIDKEIVLSAQAFVDELREQKISAIFITTALFNQISMQIPGAFKTVKTVMTGGDTADPNAFRKVLADHPPQNLLNGYGPTENTTFSTVYNCRTLKDSETHVSIGTAIANSYHYILDKNLQVLPVGVPGELYLGGDGLALGYHNRPELNTERFIKDPFSNDPNARLYKTGDLVRYMVDGNIEFIGRIDQQVKIRGFRIELGEIENALNSHEIIREAVCLAREDMPGAKQLVAYFVPKNGDIPSTSDIRKLLGNTLPDYMIPAVFISLDTMPITPNGKVDRKALPAPDQHRPDIEREYVAPRNALEEYLVDIWKEILKIEKVGIHDNLFELGANSLKAAVFANRMQKEFDEVVHVGAIFKAPRISELAMYISEYFKDAVREKFGSIEGSGSQFQVAVEDIEQANKIGPDDLDTFREIIAPLPPFKSENNVKNKPAVFLLSPPRSGSTLLRIMLAGNKQLFSPPELDLLSFNTLAERKEAFSAEGLEIWQEATIRAIMELKSCPLEQAQNIMADCEAAGMSSKDFYGQMQQWLGDGLIVDKTPTYGFDPEILKRAEDYFDQPLYIHLIRHPYAMIYSFIEAKLDKNFFRYQHHFSRRELAELIWIISNQNISEFLDDVPQTRQYRLHFENLVTNPEAEIKQLCRFMEIEFSNDMLKPYEGKKMTDGVKENSQMVGDFKFYLHKNINSSVANKWKTYHSVDFLSDISWDLAGQFGYEVEKDLARRKKETQQQKMGRIEPIPAEGDLQLSFAQQRLWFLDQMDPGNPQYNIPGAIRLQGSLDIEKLQNSLNTIIERHYSLRTVFKSSETGQASQRILEPIPLVFQRYDLSVIPPEHRDQETLLLANREAAKPFNLGSGPLLRASLIKLDETEHVMIVVMHHIISDGWSVNVFIRELSVLYNAFVKGQANPLPALAVQYADYANWQREWFAKNVLDLQLDYWKKQLSGLSPHLELPTDYARTSMVTFEGKRQVFHIKKETFEALQKLSKEHEVTLFMFLLATFQTLMYRYSGQDDFAVGTPVANRTRSEIEPLIGFFVNTLVLRADLSANPSFEELLKRTRKTAMEAFDHQDIPFEKLVDTLQPQRDMSHSPLFQVMFTLQRSDIQAMQLEGLNLKPFNMESGTAKFDLSLEMVEHTNRLVGIIEYKTGLFKSETIGRMISHFEQLLESIIEDNTKLVSALPILSASEENDLKNILGTQTLTYPKDQTIHKLFEEQALLNPDNIAVHYDYESLSYAELNRRANQLARYLRKNGLQREDIVAVLLERSTDMLVAILAVLKAGAAYLPLDPFYPPERVAFMLDDANVDILLSHRGLMEADDCSQKIIRLDADRELIDAEQTNNPDSGSTAESLAYVIYTSGSTGKPKGVMIEHRAALHLAANLKQTVYDRFPDRKLRISLNAPVPFDASVQQIVMLTQGHGLFIIPNEVRADGVKLLAYIRKHQIQVFDCVPSLLKLLLEAGLLDRDGWKPLAVLPGGEAIDELTWKTLVDQNDIEFFNMYGPTECAVDSTIFRVKDFGERPVIGKAVANARFQILDPNLQPVPLGVPGELHISGDGLARGYLNRPELTAEKFIADPSSEDKTSRMYKTGDLVRLLENGYVEFLGRVDHQVKIRGYRMELGEIEKALILHPNIKDAVVVARSPEGGDKRLVAYLVPAETGEAPNVSELRSFLNKTLPEYMIPAIFMPLAEFPMMPNGKVNRNALPEAQMDRATLGTEITGASTRAEENLINIWQNVLNIDELGIHDNFFELGGDSILSIQVIARAKQAGLLITPRQLFENPTIQQLAAVAKSGTAVIADQGLVTGPVPLTAVQNHFFGQERKDRHHWNQSVIFEVHDALDPVLLKKVSARIIEHHDALRMRFSETGSGWEQFSAENTLEVPFYFHDYSAIPGQELLETIEEKADTIQSSLNLQDGPLIRMAYFKGSEQQPDYLLIVVHHLVIDGVSWRILMDDIQLAYSQLSSNQAISLPAKTTSFKEWAEQIKAFANGEDVKDDLTYWNKLNEIEPAALPVDFSNGPNDEASAAIVSAALSVEETQALLQKVPPVYQTKINDSLVAALTKAYQKWTGKSSLIIQMEGHGREDVLENADISRTVGWFTSLFPLHLNISELNGYESILKSTADQMRQIPSNGLSFGLLRYLSDDAGVKDQLSAVAKPDIVFNYLGQFDQNNGDGINLTPLNTGMGSERSAKSEREYLFDISASVRNEQLILNVCFSTNFHNETTVNTFLSAYLEEIRSIIDHCLGKSDGSHAIPVLESIDFAEDELDDILAELDED